MRDKACSVVDLREDQRLGQHVRCAAVALAYAEVPAPKCVCTMEPAYRHFSSRSLPPSGSTHTLDMRQSTERFFRWCANNRRCGSRLSSAGRRRRTHSPRSATRASGERFGWPGRGVPQGRQLDLELAVSNAVFCAYITTTMKQ
jgi:hypothetical protein